MFLEIAQFSIEPGKEASFEATVAELRPQFLQLKGCEGLELRRSLETRGRYYLLIRWATMEAHAQFLQSDLAQRIGSIAQEFFSGPPLIEHGQLVVP